MRTIVALLIGVLVGVAVAHFGFGPIDWPDLGRRTGDAVSDAAITASVKAALALQKEFDLFGDVRVSSDDGVVTLSGSVTTRERRQLAELIARGVEGVERVVNDLEVRADPRESATTASTRR